MWWADYLPDSGATVKWPQGPNNVQIKPPYPSVKVAVKAGARAVQPVSVKTEYKLIKHLTKAS